MTPTSTPGLRTITSRGSPTFLPPSDGILQSEQAQGQKVAERRLRSAVSGSPQQTAWTGGGRGLFGRGRERALVLFTERIDGRLIFGGGGSTGLRSGLGADWLQARAALTRAKNRQQP